MKPDKAAELDERINYLSARCNLDAWTAFTEPLSMPQEMHAALVTGRPELIKLVQPRALSKEECAVIYRLVGGLIDTNMALREHAEQLAVLSKNWADAFKQLHSVGDKIRRFARFETLTAGSDDDE